MQENGTGDHTCKAEVKTQMQRMMYRYQGGRWRWEELRDWK